MVWASKRNCFLMSVSMSRAKLVAKTFLVNVFTKHIDASSIPLRSAGDPSGGDFFTDVALFRMLF
jgi:hypothetical protein